MVCFTTHLKQKSYEICEELVRLFRHFAKGNFSSRLANKAGKACTVYDTPVQDFIRFGQRFSIFK